MRPSSRRVASVLVLSALLQASPASARGFVGEQGACFTACMLPLNYVSFANMPPSPGPPGWPEKIACSDYMTSLVACMSSYCDAQGIEWGWERFGMMRDLAAPGTPLPAFEDVLRTVPPDIPEIDCLKEMGVVLTGPVRVSKSNYDDGEHTDSAFAHQMLLHQAFGSVQYALLVGMCLIGLGNRVLAFAARYGAVAWSGNLLAPWPSAHAWYRRNIGTPAMLGYSHVQPWGILSIPTRLQSIMIAIYVLINLVLGGYGYETFHNNMFWYGREDLQFARYLADRTGIMSFFNMVLLWMLAGRNDVVIWLTGWSFQSLNLFHRWTARVATVQALIHSVAYVWLKWGEFWVTMRQPYWWSGVYAMLVMGALIPLSILPLRKVAYEVFLLLHIALSVGLLVLLYIHTEMFGYDGSVWICGGIWLIDRGIRLARVVLLSFRTVGQRNAVAAITASDPGLIRMRVNTSVTIQPQPGDYYFLYSPHSLKPWENHPFTLASWEKCPSGGTTLNFLIAPLDGWTGRLRRRIEATAAAKAATETDSEEDGLVASKKAAQLRVLLEGPYGHRCDVDQYDHIVLIAGGSGIAAILPYVFALGQTERKRRISVVWTVRNAEYAADVLANELSAERTQHVSLELYLTKDSPEVARRVIAGGDLGYGALDSNKDRTDVKLLRGRPNMDELIATHVAALSEEKNTRLAVLGCGPGGMMDDLRRTVAGAYETGLATRLEYFEEAFTW